MIYILFSGWILSVLCSIIILVKAFIEKSESDFMTGVIFLIGAILIGYLIFYPFAFAILLLNRFNKL